MHNFSIKQIDHMAVEAVSAGELRQLYQMLYQLRAEARYAVGERRSGLNAIILYVEGEMREIVLLKIKYAFDLAEQLLRYPEKTENSLRILKKLISHDVLGQGERKDLTVRLEEFQRVALNTVPSKPYRGKVRKPRRRNSKQYVAVC